MTVIMIMNPVAGASRQRAALHQMVAHLRRQGFSLQLHQTHGPGHGAELARRVAIRAKEHRNVRGIIAVGGDGTIREVAEGMADTGLPLLIWPTGTENLIAKSFGFRADPRVIMSCLENGRTIPLDIGTANGQVFLVVAGIGFDAEVVHRLVRLRQGHITHLSYSGPLWRTFWEHRWPCIRILSENDLLWEGRGMVFIGNLPRYSLGLRVIRDAIGDDGLLDLCVFPCRNQLALIAHSLRTLARHHVERGGVFYRRLKHLRIESDVQVPVQLDGEAAGSIPLDIGIRPKALRLLVPPASHTQ